MSAPLPVLTTDVPVEPPEVAASAAAAEADKPQAGEAGRLVDEPSEHDPVGQNLGTVLVLVLTILATGVGIVWSKHQSRKLFVELQGLQKVRDDLDIEWNQLQLEQSTLATESVIDQAARTRLDMGIPAPEAVIYVIR